MAEYNKAQLTEMIVGKLLRNFGRTVDEATPNHMFKACAMVLRDIMSGHQIETSNHVWEAQGRQVHYLSLEFLMGRSLEKNAYNLGLLDTLTQVLEDLGFSAADLFETEPDAGLGNGGLGRLAACYLDSMTTLEIPATGYSICYELGIFKQKIIDGKQVELADNWLGLGDAWLIAKMDEAEEVRFGGRIVDHWVDGHNKPEHVGYTTVLAIPRDMEIAGYKTNHTNTLRLWDAKSPVPVDMSLYSRGEYLKAVEQQAMAEVIAKVLYPDDNHYEGKSLRLKQQYFFVSATAQSIVRQHRAQYGTLRNFHQKHVIQINDTHPTLVIPELMRILLDVEGYSWDEAWHIVTNTVCYTNHTVLAEALERWPQNLIESLLPRIWEILKEIAARYQRELEQAAFRMGGSSYRAPVQTVGRFLSGQAGADFGRVEPTYAIGTEAGDFDRLFTAGVASMLRKGLENFARKLPAYAAADAVLTAPETRTSSPVRILRDETFQSALRGLYPCGEGAGYAGGILSAAADGMHCAEQLCQSIQKESDCL